MSDLPTSIERLFLTLTQVTCPYGYEDDLYGPMLSNLGFVPDEYGNYYQELGSGSRTAFTAHLDTAGLEKQPLSVLHRKEKGIISTDGSTILGADDKAGMCVLLSMIMWQVPGHYFLFAGEECGRVGSKLHATSNKYDFDRMISFDRYGTDSIITHQMAERSCSDEFADALIAEFSQHGMTFKKDDGGTYTDSYSYFDTVPECTNISVGYDLQHTMKETQDIEFLTELAEVVTLIDWEDLPTVQDPANRERVWSSGYGYGGGAYGWWKDDDFYQYQDEMREVADDVPWYQTMDLTFDELAEEAKLGRANLGDVETWIYMNPDLAATALFGFLSLCNTQTIQQIQTLVAGDQVPKEGGEHEHDDAPSIASPSNS